MAVPSSLRRFVLVATLLTFAACGGDDGGDIIDPDPDPTPPSAPTGVQVESNAEASATISWSTVASATGYTVYYAAETGVTPATYSSLDGGARVTNAASPLDVTGLGDHTTWYFVVTASNADGESNPSSQVMVEPKRGLRPESDIDLPAGTHTFTEIDIPDGVTVTATGDLTLEVEGDASIAGALVGDCRSMSLRAAGAITVEGLVDNRCGTAPAEDAPGLTLLSDGALTLGAAGSTELVVASDGVVRYTDTATENDDLEPKIDVEATPAGAALGSRVPARQAQGIQAVYNGLHEAAEFRGSRAGDITVNGTLRAKAGQAAAGLTGSPLCDNSAGVGKPGGKIYLYARGGTLQLAAAAKLEGGDGGTGGACMATGEGATAIGGPGGPGGGVFFGGTTMVIGAGATIKRGNGGTGGRADAVGDHADEPCEDGWPATATGGPGGRAGGAGWISESAPTIQGAPSEDGANGGTGGVGYAKGGDGTACVCEAEDRSGGDGGDALSTGGQGGDGARGKLFDIVAGSHHKGWGGAAEALGGFGGDGADCCDEGGPGGAGGAGGDASANGGAQGARGTTEGRTGVATADGGTGGEGGDGSPVGSGGTGGTASAVGHDPGSQADDGSPGLDGATCPGTIQAWVDIGALPLTGGVIAAGTYEVPLRDPSGAQISTITLTYPNGGYLGSNPLRTGLDPQAELIIQSSGFDVSGQAAFFGDALVCFVNVPAASSSNPITIEVLDAQMNVIASFPWPPPSSGGPAGISGMAVEDGCAPPVLFGPAAAFLLIRGIVGNFIDILFGPSVLWTVGTM